MAKRVQRSRSKRRSTRRKQRGGALPFVEELAGITFPAELPLRFSDKKIASGALLPRDLTRYAPTIEWAAPKGEFRTLICFDPDAPARAWCHWFVVNCTSSIPLSGETFMEWNPPSPPQGVHRYYLCLFAHTSKVLDEDRPKQQGYFEVKSVIEKYSMRPVAATMVKVTARQGA